MTPGDIILVNARVLEVREGVYTCELLDGLGHAQVVVNESAAVVIPLSQNPPAST
jgi:hypothetical protein